MSTSLAEVKGEARLVAMRKLHEGSGPVITLTAPSRCNGNICGIAIVSCPPAGILLSSYSCEPDVRSASKPSSLALSVVKNLFHPGSERWG